MAILTVPTTTADLLDNCATSSATGEGQITVLGESAPSHGEVNANGQWTDGCGNNGFDDSVSGTWNGGGHVTGTGGGNANPGLLVSGLASDGAGEFSATENADNSFVCQVTWKTDSSFYKGDGGYVTPNHSETSFTVSFKCTSPAVEDDTVFSGAMGLTTQNTGP